MEALRDAGVPDGVCNLVMGPGGTVGDELATSEDIDGIVFTGSYDVGMDLQRSFNEAYPRPCIVEMGGKNPAIVMQSADLDKAAEGIMRSAFGFGGQKCSANSRVYVERSVHDELVRKLVEQTEQLTIGDPLATRELAGAGDRPARRRTLSTRRWPKPAQTEPSTQAARSSPKATWRAASTSSPPW